MKYVNILNKWNEHINFPIFFPIHVDVLLQLALQSKKILLFVYWNINLQESWTLNYCCVSDGKVPHNLNFNSSTVFPYFLFVTLHLTDKVHFTIILINSFEWRSFCFVSNFHLFLSFTDKILRSNKGLWKVISFQKVALCFNSQ